MELKRWIILLIALLTADCPTGRAEGFRNLESEITALMRDYKAIGVSVAVVKDNHIVYSGAFGYKDRESQTKLSPDDAFRIASVTKTFVATAIMKLIEKKRLSLDDDVNSYLDFPVRNPNYPDKPVTVRMLLCHRSSINDSQGCNSFDMINPATNDNYHACYNDYEPGSRYQYCNYNYNILGAVIENVSGKRIDRFIVNKIIRPLRLHGRFVVTEKDSAVFAKAYRYSEKRDSFVLSRDAYFPFDYELERYRLGYSTPVLYPAGGLKISATELAKYMLMHMNNGKYKIRRIIKEESEFSLRQLPVQTHWYALSITHYNNNVLPGEELLGQTGGGYGIHTAMIFHPEKKYGFVVFCNGCNSKSTNGRELNYEIIECLYRNLISADFDGQVMR
ncbi:MAG: beta-lactamase family protein [Bacteroidaceae bacterium]|nr:beta-lactamase family protein [Bacteroidaceae bacterium]